MKRLFVLLLLVGLQTSFTQWTQTSAPPTILTWSLVSEGQTVFAGTHDFGVVRSTDNGLTWESANNGLGKRNIYSLGLNGTLVLAGTDSGLYRSTDSGSSWQATPVAGAKYFETLCFDGAFWFAGAGDKGVYRSTDNGISWLPADSGLATIHVNTIVFSGSSLYAGTSNGVFSSADSGATWNLLANGLKGVYPNVRAFTSANGSLFAGGAGGIQRSTDGGETWAHVDSGLTWRFILGFAVFNSTIFACGWGGVFVSTDTGFTWSEINSDLPTTNILQIANGDTTYIPSPGTRALGIVGTDLFAGLDSNGIWKRPLGQIVSSVEPQADHLSPEGFLLGQNFPNPFNPTTMITFTIPHPSNVTMAVFDLLGRKVYTIVSRDFTSGTFDVEWDASSLPSGVYICRLQAGSFQAARKMILQK